MDLPNNPHSNSNPNSEFDIPPAPSPYASPTTKLDLADTATGYNTESFYSMHGRIGRVRYLAYGMLLNLVLLAIFIVATIVLSFIAGLIAGLFGSSDVSETPILIAVGLAYLILIVGQFYTLLIPAKRRLHDLNQSGWLSLLLVVPLVNVIFWLYLLFAPGDAGVNDYGRPAAPATTPLIILAVVLPLLGVMVIGILAAIAIPAYQDYIERATEVQMQQALQ